MQIAGRRRHDHVRTQGRGHRIRYTPDDSQIGVNMHALTAFLQDRRAVRTAQVVVERLIYDRAQVDLRPVARAEKEIALQR